MEKPDIQPTASHTEKANAVSHDGFDDIAPDAVGGHSVADLPKNYYTNWRVIGTIVAFTLGYTAAFWALIMPANALTIINADIGPSPDSVWIVLAPSLGEVITFVTVGRLSDIFGRRWYFVCANALSFVGFMVASRAQTINTLIGANIMSGLGSGVQISGAILSGELVPNKYRFLSYGIVAGFFGPISAIAPGIARLLCDRTEQGWRWIYYIVAILSFLAMAIQYFCYHPPRFEQLHQHTSKRETLKHLDYVGLVVLAGSTASLLLGISWGGQRYPWQSASVIAPIVVGGVGLIALILWEHFGKVQHPVLPLYLFTKRNFDCLVVIASVGSMIFYALSILWPQQLAISFGQSATASGWISCTIPGGNIVGVIACGIFSHRIKHLKWQLTFLAVVFTALIGAMAAANGDNLAMPIVFSVLSSFCIGYLEVICANAGPLVLEAKDMGVANGVQWGVRTGLSSLASSIYVTILNNRITSNFRKYVVPAALAAGLPETSLEAFIKALAAGDQAAIMKIPGISMEIITSATGAAHTAYFRSFQTVYYTSVAFGAVAIIAALSTSGQGLDGKLTTDISRKIRGIDRAPQTSQIDIEKVE